jgi:hypothetical protein
VTVSDSYRGADDILARIRDALGMEKGEKLVVQTPRFEREDGVEPGEPPLTYTAMNRLRRADESELKELGLRKWSDDTGLWLLPHEWHPHIPDHYPLLSILDETSTRAEMPANPDKRFGVLSVGIVPDFEHSDGRLERDDGDD